MKRRGLIVLLLCVVISGTVVLFGQPAAQDEFVPVGAVPPGEQLPAAPLVIIAYAVVWVAVLGYLWVIWRRLGRVERELAEVSRRIGTPRAPGS